MGRIVGATDSNPIVDWQRTYEVDRLVWVICSQPAVYHLGGWSSFQPFIVGFSEVTILNVCSHREQSVRRQNQYDGEGREAAISSHRGGTRDALLGDVATT